MSHQIFDHIWDVMMQLRSVTHRSFVCKHGLSFIKMAVLHYVQEAQEPTMKEIASFLEVTMPSTSVIVSDLVSLRFVIRVPDIQDRRIIRIRITPQGKKMLEKQLVSLQKTTRDYLNTLSLIEQKQLLSILKKIRHHISTI